MDPTHPPLDFPIHGLAEWHGPQWLAMVDGRLGHPAEGVWLHHGSGIPHDAREPWARIQTSRADRFRAGDDQHALAFGAAFALVDATMPAPAERRADYKDRAVAFAEDRSQHHAEWRPVGWTVDGQPRRASVLDLAGAWAGFTRDVPGVDVVVVAHDVDPDGLALAEVVDSSSSYHFDSARPITFPDTLEESRAAAGIDRAAGDDVWWPVHPDHATL